MFLDMRVIVILGGECGDREGEDRHCVMGVVGPYQSPSDAKPDFDRIKAEGLIPHWMSVQSRAQWFGETGQGPLPRTPGAGPGP